jgi:uncharacterized protein with beta-barrel porin domain
MSIVNNIHMPTSWNRNLIYKTIAIASLATGSSFASAAPGCGPIVSVDQGRCVINGGSDLTINSGVTVEVSSSTFYAVTVTSVLDSGATVTNNGTISVDLGEDGYINAAGIYAQDTVYGAIINEGLIQVSGTETSDTAYMRGINVRGSVYGGEITNNGTIDVDLTIETDYTAYVHGIYIQSGIYNSGSVTNNGLIDIDVSNTSDPYAIYANGILNDGQIYGGGSIVNGGTIDVNINASSSTAAGYGIYQNYHVYSGEIINSGVINVTVVGSDAEGFGISVDGSVYSSGSLIENEGTITVSVTGSSDATALGIEVYGGIYNESQLVNSGVIDLTAIGEYAEAIGIVAGEVYSGSAIVNSGSIKVLAQAAGDNESAWAWGISVNSSVYGGSVVNEGTIKADATALADSAYATGIYAYGVYSGGSISNTGTIDVDSKSISDGIYGGMARAIGIFVYTDSSDYQVTNAGLINANASGTSAYAAGIWQYSSAYGANTSIENSGTINATAVGTTDAFAGGMVFSSTVNGGAKAINSGTITAVASVTDATISLGKGGGGGALAAGMISEYPIYSGSFINSESGVINATASANATGFAKAVGMAVVSNVYDAGVIENKGVINVIASGEGESVMAIGMEIGQLGAADFSYVSGSGATAVYELVDTSEAGTVINSGTITATANGANAEAYSLYINNDLEDFDGVEIVGEVINSGELNGDVKLGGIVSLTNSGKFTGGGSIGGDYTVTAGGTHNFRIASASDYDQLVVGGTADLSAGNLGVAVSVDETIAIGDSFEDVITAETLVVGDTIVITDDSTFWDFEATADATSLDIVAVEGETVVDIVSGESGESEPAYTPLVYALGIAAALDELISLGTNNADINDLIMALDDLETPEQIANAVGQLVPVLVGQGSQVAQQIVGQIGSVVSQRMSSGRVKGGVSSGDPMMTDAHVWAKVLGTKAEQGEIDGVNGYDADSYSFTLGFDGDISEDTLVGLAFSYSEADIDGDTIANNQLDIEGYQLTGYASYTLDESAFVDVLVTVGSNSNEASRQVNIGTINLAAKADYDSWFTRVYSAIGRDYQVNEQLTITPMLSLSYTYIDEDSYTEKGLGGFGLDVKGRDEESAVAGLDILGVYDVDDQNRITAHVGMGYEMLSGSTIVSSSFIGGGSVFKTEGPDRDPENYRFGVGYELNASDSLELRVNYDYEAAEEYDNQILSATARWLW